LDGRLRRLMNSHSFEGIGVVSGDVAIREVGRNLCQRVTLLWVKVRRDFVLSRHSSGCSSFVPVVAYCLLACQ
jgi:hypothetical protein